MTFLGKICVTMRKYQTVREFKKTKNFAEEKIKKFYIPPSMPKSLKWSLPLVWKAVVAQFIRAFIYNTNIDTFIRYIKYSQVLYTATLTLQRISPGAI
jgi:hypothetical protein